MSKLPPIYTPPLKRNEEYVPKISITPVQKVNYVSDSECGKVGKVKKVVSAKDLNATDSSYGGKKNPDITITRQNPLFNRNNNIGLSFSLSPQREKNLGINALVSPRTADTPRPNFSEEEKEISPTRRISSPALPLTNYGRPLSSTTQRSAFVSPRQNSNTFISPRQNVNLAETAESAEKKAKRSNFEEFIKSQLKSKAIKDVLFPNFLLARVRELNDPIAIGDALRNLRKDLVGKEETNLNKIFFHLFKDRDTISCIYRFAAKEDCTFLREQKWYKKNPLVFIDNLLTFFTRQMMDDQLFRTNNALTPFTEPYLQKLLTDQIEACLEVLKKRNYELTSDLLREYYLTIYSKDVPPEALILFNSIKLLVTERFEKESKKSLNEVENSNLLKFSMKRSDSEQQIADKNENAMEQASHPTAQQRAFAAISEVLFLRCLTFNLSDHFCSQYSDLSKFELVKVIGVIDGELKYRLMGNPIKSFPPDSPFYDIPEQLFPAHKAFIERISRLF